MAEEGSLLVMRAAKEHLGGHNKALATSAGAVLSAQREIAGPAPPCLSRPFNSIHPPTHAQDFLGLPLPPLPPTHTTTTTAALIGPQENPRVAAVENLEDMWEH